MVFHRGGSSGSRGPGKGLAPGPGTLPAFPAPQGGTGCRLLLPGVSHAPHESALQALARQRGLPAPGLLLKTRLCGFTPSSSPSPAPCPSSSPQPPWLAPAPHTQLWGPGVTGSSSPARCALQAQGGVCPHGAFSLGTLRPDTCAHLALGCTRRPGTPEGRAGRKSLGRTADLTGVGTGTEPTLFLPSGTTSALRGHKPPDQTQPGLATRRMR